MKTINVQLTGTTPIMFHRFTEEAQKDATKGERVSVKGSKSQKPKKIAERFLYIGKNKKPVVPQSMLMAAFMSAGKLFKVGKRQISTQKTSLLPGFISISEFEVPVTHEQPWEVDSRPVCNPSTGGRFLQHRPKFPDWKLNFTMEVDEEMFTVDLIRDVVEMAGKVSGIGAYRPAVRGIFGKFVVTKWDVVEK